MIPRSQVDLENSSPAGKCYLSSDVKIKGSITLQKELLIDGKVQGQINSDGVLTIGENADIRLYSHRRAPSSLASAHHPCVKKTASRTYVQAWRPAIERPLSSERLR
jgi:hypothetical protein